MNFKNKLSQPGFLLAGLTVLAVLTLVLGFTQIRGAIQGPFPQYKTKSIPITEEDIANYLKKQDTDQDGLSDYDERYTHKTSVYLADSDSDGYTDFEETQAKSNPLDPQSTPYRKKESQGSALEQVFMSSPGPGQESSEEISTQEIRNLLIQSGLDSDIVDKIDDKTLKELYNETKKETGINPQSMEVVSDQSSELTPEEIRQILLLGGADPEILEQVDDLTLKMLFEQMVQESR